jgi:hypothetical protein
VHGGIAVEAVAGSLMVFEAGLVGVVPLVVRFWTVWTTRLADAAVLSWAHTV